MCSHGNPHVDLRDSMWPFKDELIETEFITMYVYIERVILESKLPPQRVYKAQRLLQLCQRDAF